MCGQNPAFLILDLSWIEEWEQNYRWFFHRFPVRDLIQAVVAIPYELDAQELFWHEVEKRIPEPELNILDAEKVDVMFDSLFAKFYMQIRIFVGPDDDNYIYHAWLDRNSLVLKKL